MANLTDVPPTVYFNVPAGYAQLVPALEADPVFAARFFSRLRLLFNAGAALPGRLRDRLGELAVRVAGHEVPVTGSWGATETAPAVTAAHFGYADARCIGAPLPGAEVKLVPVASADEGAVGRGDEPDDAHPGGRRYEIRARGPMVTPGYFGRPDLTTTAFDEQGFYRSGDAVVAGRSRRPQRRAGVPGPHRRGLQARDGHVRPGRGGARPRCCPLSPVLSDVVIAGEEPHWVAALAWLNLAEARRLLGREPQPQGELIADEAVRKVLAQALAGHNATAGSAARVGGCWYGPPGRPGRRGDHRQGLRQPAAGAGRPGRPGRNAVRRARPAGVIVADPSA